MDLPEENIKKFQMLYKRCFGIEISYEDAYKSGVDLINIMRLIYKPITKVELKKLQKRRKEIKECL